MHKLISYISIILLLGALVTGCRESMPKDKSIREILEVYRQSPDSALTLVGSIDPDKLSSKYDLSVYSLLKADNEDLNGDSVSDLAGLEKASEFFGDQGINDLQMSSLILLGKSYLHKDEYAKSILLLKQAEKIALALEDYKNAGYINRIIQVVYQHIYYGKNDLEHAKRSLEYYTKTGNLHNIRVAKYSLCEAFFNNHDYEECITLSKANIEEARTHNDSLYTAQNLSLLGSSYLFTKSNDSAIAVLDTLLTNYSKYPEIYDLINAG